MPDDHPSQETENHNSSIAVCVITYYPRWYKGKIHSVYHTDKVRGDLALDFIKLAKDKGCQMVVVDGKSSADFQQELVNIPSINILRRKSLRRSPSKRQAIKFAASLPGIKIIITTEAEKVSLITDCLDLIVKPLLGDEADIIIPNRDEKLFKQTYPGYMYESELEGNDLYNEYLKSHGLLEEDQFLDMFFGPRSFRNDPKVIRLFMKRFKISLGGFTLPREYFDPEELSDTSFFPVVQALKKGLRVMAVEVPFKYPSLQKENEDIGDKETFVGKRRSQRLGLLVELTHFLAYLEKNPSSRLRKMK